jgi:hypothetical protein
VATSLWSEPARLDRIEALRLYTQGSAWFSQEQERKGALRPGQFADVAVLSADYFSVDDEEITAIESVLTIMDGEIVFAQGPFSGLAPPPLPVEPDWSLIEEFGGAYVPRKVGSPGGGGGSVLGGAHLDVGGSQRIWSHGWGWTMVASITSAMMAKSRSEPAGRSKSTHSRVPHRRAECDRWLRPESVERRAVFSGEPYLVDFSTC